MLILGFTKSFPNDFQIHVIHLPLVLRLDIDRFLEYTIYEEWFVSPEVPVCKQVTLVSNGPFFIEILVLAGAQFSKTVSVRQGECLFFITTLCK